MVGRDFLMKRYKTANRIFLASAILLGIAMGVRYFYRDALAGLFYFLAQSCLIGCFADWFAVEALFRNRLHLPLFKPLIPANREPFSGGFRKRWKENWWGKKLLLTC